MELHFSVEGSLFKAWNGHIAEVWVGMEIEGETLVRKIASIDEGGEVINRDGTVGESQNS